MDVSRGLPDGPDRRPVRTDSRVLLGGNSRERLRSPLVASYGHVSSVVSNAGFTAATARFAEAATTGQTTPLSSFTPSALTLVDAQLWAAIS